MRFLLQAAIAVAFLNAGVQAAELDEAKRNINEGLRLLSPDIEITHIRPAPVDGLYEVLIGPDVFYMTGDGRYVLRGEMLDLGERRNLSELARAENRRAVLGEIPRADMIEFSNGDARHAVYIFTDPDCGYCRKLHQHVPYLTDRGVAVRYLAYPRAGVDSDTYKKMVSVWCAGDRQAAMNKAKAGQQVEQRHCANPVEAQLETGRRLGVRGTPAIILENGRQLPGYVEPDELLAILEDAR